MCGIAGMVGGRLDVQALEQMAETMARRGPDQSGIWVGEQVAFAHRRLAVIDVEGGRQPMLRTYGGVEYAMVYNGELYNTSELRKELEEKGYVWMTHADTEVLLAAFAEWGSGCLDKLNGIYAFAVWNTRSRELFFARDRIGVKPFFFLEKDGQLLFASEIKTLLAHPKVEAEIDAQSVAELMLVGPGRTPGYGVFRGIRELPAGWCGTYADGCLHLEQYWRLEDREHRDSLGETIQTVRELVQDAVRRQLVSDVPVCTFLSGGLDSSIISAIAAKHFAEQGKQLHTVSVTYKDNAKYFQATHFQPNSDDSYIGKMNEAIGAENHLIVLDTPQLVEALFEAVKARDLPGMADVDASLLLFCREIKKIGTVALSGECADEIFGGYPWYRDPDVRERDGFPWAQSTDYRASFLQPEWLENLDPAQYVDEKYRATVAQVEDIGIRTPEDRRIRAMTRLNFGWFMQTLLEPKETKEKRKISGNLLRKPPGTGIMELTATTQGCVCGAFWKNSVRILLRKLEIQPVFLCFRAAFGHYFSGKIALAELCGIVLRINHQQEVQQRGEGLCGLFQPHWDDGAGGYGNCPAHRGRGAVPDGAL